MIRHRSVQPIIKKTDAIKNWPPIKTKKDAQSFLGTVNYFRIYIAHCAQKSEGLPEFIKGKLKYNDTKVSQSVQQLKDALTSKTVLVPLIPNADIKIYCDASHSAAGAIIEMGQNNRKVGVLAYYLKAFSSDKIMWPIWQKELYSVVLVLQRFGYLISDRSIEIYTDNQTVEFISQKKYERPEAKLYRWLSYLANFQSQFCPIRSQQNPSDGLSRQYQDTLKYCMLQ